MIIVWGSKLMGRVDVVPGMFHVATKFGHIYYFPMIPAGTYVVLSQSSESFNGVRIPLSFKSIAFAWLRAAMLIVSIVTVLWAVMTAADGRSGEWILPTISAAATCALFWLVTWSKPCTRASARRAAQLAEKIGLSENGMAHLASIYGNDLGEKGPGQGFEVVPSSPHAAQAATAGTAAAAAHRPLR